MCIMIREVEYQSEVVTLEGLGYFHFSMYLDIEGGTSYAGAGPHVYTEVNKKVSLYSNVFFKD